MNYKKTFEPLDGFYFNTPLLMYDKDDHEYMIMFNKDVEKDFFDALMKWQQAE